MSKEKEEVTNKAAACPLLPGSRHDGFLGG